MGSFRVFFVAPSVFKHAQTTTSQRNELKQRGHGHHERQTLEQCWAAPSCPPRHCGLQKETLKGADDYDASRCSLVTANVDYGAK